MGVHPDTGGGFSSAIISVFRDDFLVIAHLYREHAETANCHSLSTSLTASQIYVSMLPAFNTPRKCWFRCYLPTVILRVFYHLRGEGFRKLVRIIMNCTERRNDEVDTPSAPLLRQHIVTSLADDLC